jgi:hypothetical protein
MKKWLTGFVLLLATGFLSAQDCRNYYYLQNNKTVEMTIYNRKGDVSGKQVYTVSNVANSGGTTSATVESEMFDKKGKSITRAGNTIKCSGGVMMIDMKIFIPQQQAEQFNKAEASSKNVYLEYPSNMKPGDQLKNGAFTIEINKSGIQQTLSMTIDDRKVEGKETITTPAGTWECFRITYHSKLVIKTGPIGIPLNIEGTEWFALGFGIVKTESKSGKTEITAIK